MICSSNYVVETPQGGDGYALCAVACSGSDSDSHTSSVDDLYCTQTFLEPVKMSQQIARQRDQSHFGTGSSQIMDTVSLKRGSRAEEFKECYLFTWENKSKLWLWDSRRLLAAKVHGDKHKDKLHSIQAIMLRGKLVHLICSRCNNYLDTTRMIYSCSACDFDLCPDCRMMWTMYPRLDHDQEQQLLCDWSSLAIDQVEN